MWTAAILAGLQVAGQLAPLVTSSTQVGSIIKFLQEVVPIGIDTIEGAAPLVKNIVTALRSNEDTISEEQWTALDVIEAKIDDDFDAAAAAAQAADAKTKP